MILLLFQNFFRKTFEERKRDRQWEGGGGGVSILSMTELVDLKHLVSNDDLGDLTFATMGDDYNYFSMYTITVYV